MRKVDPKKRLEELDEVLSALAHPSRRHILLVIRFRGGMMTAGEIDGRFSHKWPTTSRHLRVLEQAGLVVCEKEGRTRIYRVNSEKLEVVRDWLKWFDASPPEGALLTNKPVAPPEKRTIKNKIRG